MEEDVEDEAEGRAARVSRLPAESESEDLVGGCTAEDSEELREFSDEELPRTGGDTLLLVGIGLFWEARNSKGMTGRPWGYLLQAQGILKLPGLREHLTCNDISAMILVRI